MDTNKITSLSELWEHYQKTPIRQTLGTRSAIHDIASKLMSDVNDSNNDMYKMSIFKKLWNKKVIHIPESGVKALEVTDRRYQKDMFEHLDDYPDNEQNEIVFSNGMLYGTDIRNYLRGYQIWSGVAKNDMVDQAYNSLAGYVKSTMPGILATRLTQSAQVLNIDGNGDYLLTSDARNSNEASLKESEHWSIKDSDEPLLNTGTYIVRICKGAYVRMKEIHTAGNTLFCNKWIYVVDYGATLELDRSVLQSDGVIDSTHIIQYPKSRLKINTYDKGQQWRNINITAYQNTVTELNGSTHLTTSDSANFVDVHHKGHSGNSNIKYNSAIYNDHTGNFIGTVQVEKKAEGTKSEMANKNLLVDPLSRAFSMPILHINTKEIECTHGCTTSKISEDEIYYLQSLGVDRSNAKTIIANGHIQI